MSDYWKSILEFYGKKGKFVCRNRGAADKSAEIEVTHLIFPPADQRELEKIEARSKKVLPASYRKFHSLMNGGLLFTQVRNGNCNSGMILYSLEMVEQQHAGVVKWLSEWLDEDPDSFGGAAEASRFHEWLRHVLIIGEEHQSGNYIAFDYNRKHQGTECPIIFMDHETPFSYAEIDDNEPVLAGTVDGLLFKAAQDPAKFLMDSLGSTVTYLDDSKEQWYPIEYRLSEKPNSNPYGRLNEATE